MLQIELLKYWSILIQVIDNILVEKWIQLIYVPEALWIKPISYSKIKMESHGYLAQVF